MSATPLEIDLRGKTLDEVMTALREHGFEVKSSDITEYWDAHERAMGKDPKGGPVKIIWIKGAEAALLTVTIFNGKTFTLDSEQDLHLFEPCEGQPELAWSAITTKYIMS